MSAEARDALECAAEDFEQIRQLVGNDWPPENVVPMVAGALAAVPVQAAKIERLRKALQKIVDLTTDSRTGHLWTAVGIAANALASNGLSDLGIKRAEVLDGGDERPAGDEVARLRVLLGRALDALDSVNATLVGIEHAAEETYLDEALDIRSAAGAQ